MVEAELIDSISMYAAMFLLALCFYWHCICDVYGEGPADWTGML